jgi:hypothetical protein
MTLLFDDLDCGWKEHLYSVFQVSLMSRGEPKGIDTLKTNVQLALRSDNRDLLPSPHSASKILQCISSPRRLLYADDS